METKTAVIIILGLVILALLLITINYWYQKGIPVIGIVIDFVMESWYKSTWLTGDPGEWPKWAE